MGAIASGGIIVLQPYVIRALGIAQDTIDAAAARERIEIERREAAYRAGRPPISLADRTVILVDDGLATGSTMKAAVRTLRSPGSRSVARTVIVAVPIGAPGTCEELSREADRIVCLHTPVHFHAVGEFYRSFDQTSDEEVCALLAETAAGRGTPSHHPE
jgi:putative phosphoribosyl transferase